MGSREGPLWRRITYKLPAAGDPCEGNPGTVTVQDAHGATTEAKMLWWPYLEGLLQGMRCGAQSAETQALPFDFWGGLVGYLGYELKAECGGAAAHHSRLPDAAVFMADRHAVCIF
jgi:para-aminobenzoate synthetase